MVLTVHHDDFQRAPIPKAKPKVIRIILTAVFSSRATHQTNFRSQYTLIPAFYQYITLMQLIYMLVPKLHITSLAHSHTFVCES